MRLSMTAVPLVAAAVLLASPGLALAAPAASAASTASTASATHQAAAVSGRAHEQDRSEPVLSSGSSGRAVRDLQRRLSALHYYTGGIDNSFGAGTLEAVWAFQEVQGISPTGTVGSVTWRALAHPRTPRALVPRGGSSRVEVNLGSHYLVVYRDGRIVLISHVSTGGGYYFCSTGGCSYAITPTGNFRTRVYMPGWVRVPLGAMYNPVFFIGTEFAIHGETYVPLAPVSHGCVRIPMDVAQIFHRLVRTPGTPVYIRW
jgi:lipoprotein-anchoring transpeptidase ErfK/SrfK